MLTRFALPLMLLTLSLPACQKYEAAAKSNPTPSQSPGSSASPGPSVGPVATPATSLVSTKPAAIDLNAQVVVFGYHRFVNSVRHPDTEITPAVFEAQMKELKDKGVSVIAMQDFLAWKRGEKAIPPRAAIVTLDDGWKSQYDVAWPILLGIRVNCFAVPYGNINDRIRDVAKKEGYEAVFTVYGQRLVHNAPNNSLGRYLIEANKPKVFAEAINFSGATSSGAAPVAEIGSSELSTQPANGEAVKTALPLIKANLASMGPLDSGSVQMRVSGLGLVPATYDAKAQTIAYQVTQRLHDRTCTVFISAKSGGKKVEAHWAFTVDETSSGAAANPSPAASRTPPKK